LNGTSWETVFPPEGNLHWRFTDLEEARDGSIWAATNWGALRIKGPEAHLYTTDGIGRAVRAIAPYVRLSVVPDEFVPQRSIPTRVGLMSTPAGGAGLTEHLLIYAVIDGGPADQVGVKSGDRIIAVDDEHLLDPNTALLGPPGTVVNLRVKRDGQEDPITFEVVREAGSETFKPFVVYDIKTAKDGSVWFGLETGEVLRFQYLLEGKGATGLWGLHTPENGLVIGEMPRIGQSPDGQIWVGSNTQQSGLNRFDGVSWDHTRLSNLGGSDLNTSFATTPDGAFWVGGNSLNVFRNGKWSAYSDVEEIPTQRTRLLVTSDSALWVLGLGQYASRLSLQTSRWNAYEGLNFQVEAPDGSQWFLSDDDRVVTYDGKSWTHYGSNDGIMDFPAAVYTTKNGTVWVTGAHGGSAATSVMKGKRFERKIHPKLSWNIDQRSFLEAQDGSVWLGACVDFRPELGHVGGLLQHKDGKWTHHTPPDAPDFTYGVAQTSVGLLWFAGEEVKLYNGKVWLELQNPSVISRDWTDAIYTTPQGGLWVGTPTHGVFEYDGSVWRNHTQAVSKEIVATTSRSLGTDKGHGVWISHANGFPDRHELVCRKRVSIC